MPTRSPIPAQLAARLNLYALARELDTFPATSAERGRRYARDGHVQRIDVDRKGSGFAAIVRGTTEYRCEWESVGNNWINVCSCPVVEFCKHSYAAAAVFLAHALPNTREIRKGRGVVRLPGVGSPTLPRVRVVAVRFRGYEDLDEDWDEFDDEEDWEADPEDDEDDEDDEDEEITSRRSGIRSWSRIRADQRGAGRRQRPGAQATAPEIEVSDDTIVRLFEHLRSARTRGEREQVALALAMAVRAPLRDLELPRVTSEEDGDVRCLVLAEILQKVAERPLPAAATAGLFSNSARQVLRQRRESELLEQLSRWSQPTGRTYPKHLRAVVRLTAGAGSYFSFVLVPHLSSTRMRDEPRTPEQIRALCDELARNPGVLSPTGTRLAHWLNEYYATRPWWTRNEMAPSELERLLIAVESSGLVTWEAGDMPHVLARAGLCDGDVARAEPGGASVEPVCTVVDGTASLELQVHLANGRTCALEEVAFRFAERLGETGHVLADGALWRLRQVPPAGIIESFRTLSRIPLDADRRLPTLRMLAPVSRQITRTLERHTRRVPCRPVFLMGGDSAEDLSIRLLAVPAGACWQPSVGDDASVSPTGGDPLIFEYGRDACWRPVNEQASRPAVRPDAWLVLGDAIDATTEAAGVEEHGDLGPDVAPDVAPSVAPSVAPDVAPDVAQDVAQDAAPDVRPEIWLEEPDRESLQPAEQWLSTACPGADRERWTLPLQPPHFRELVRAWEARPASASFYATRRIHRLLRDGRAMPKLDIRTSGKDWFEVRLEWRIAGESISPSEVAALFSGGGGFVRVGDGWVRGVAGEQMREAAAALADAGIDACESEQRLGLWQLAAAAPDALARLEEVGADPATVAAAQHLRRKVETFRGLPRVAVPRTFRGELRGYQRDGVDFLSFTSSIGSGAILADDMGLGKTVQALAWLERLRLAGRSGPALVVCPASVTHNWRAEAAQFAPKMRVAVLASGRERFELIRRAGDYDLLVTNYALLRRDAAAWSEVELGALVLDEAQNVKNPDAAVAKAARSLKARHRLALTGTPLENRTRDVWSILECVSPGYLGPRKRFEERFDRPDVAEADRRLLASRLRPILLRRRKREVAPDLPARVEETRRCELTTEQRRLYLATLQASRQLVDRLGRKGQEGEKARIQILAALTRLRQICCHPGLVDPGHAAERSSKFELLFEVLEPLLDEGHKVLVFSQFARCLQLLAGELSRRGLRHFVLTGQTQKRERVVAEFQGCEEPAVFLVSLKAGGTGLNLTAASYVVLFDPWWNPAVEAQAIDRTHRIGQTRSVMAYRLVAADTIEEKILELQRDKATLADAVVDDESFGRRLAKEDLAYLLEG